QTGGEGRGERAYGAPQTDGDGSLLSRERRQDESQRGRHEERGPHGLEDPEPNQRERARGEAAEGRGEREQRDADQEHPLPPVEIRQSPGRDQQGAEYDRVGVEDPRERRGRRRREGRPDPVERDEEDGGVQEHEEQREAAQRERRPGTGRVLVALYQYHLYFSVV